MAKRVVCYARVSTMKQIGEDKVSIGQQIADMEALCQRQDSWKIVATFVDDRDYIATKKPKRGKKINPSGTRDDRPGLLKMLEEVRTGNVDVILCAFDDRLYRHERVVTAIKDALEEGESKRRGREIEVWQTSGIITKDFMYLQAMMWRKENERRKERFMSGRIGTLTQGRWPGIYDRLGYVTQKEDGKRGVQIILADDSEVQTVKNIFQWADTGHSLRQIRSKLLARGLEPKGINKRKKKRDWDQSILSYILRSVDYTGVATWRFANGGKKIKPPASIPGEIYQRVQADGFAKWVYKGNIMYSIKIPQIISPELFDRVQKRLGKNGKNRKLAIRNAKGIYLLQGIGYCGCGSKLNYFSAPYSYKKLADGTTKKYKRKKPLRQYRCIQATNHSDEPHPYPRVWNGPKLDYAVWRHIADEIIQKPNLIREQVINRQSTLQDQGDSLEVDLSKAKQRLEQIDYECITYTRQLARGKISEDMFDLLVAEADQQREDILAEIKELEVLRDDALSVQAGLDYAYNLMEAINKKLPEINQTPEELSLLSPDQQNSILLKRREIIRALCERVIVDSSGEIIIEGLLDGGEVSQFDLNSTHPDQASRTPAACQATPSSAR